MEVDRVGLVKAAKELNDVMGLDPEINTSLKNERLIERIKKESEQLSEDDELSAPTVSTLGKLGIALPGKTNKKAKAKAEEVEEEEEEKPKAKPAKKGKVAVAEEEDEEEEEETEEEEEEEEEEETEEDEEEEEEEETEEDEEAEGEELVQLVTNTQKLSELKKMVMEIDEFKKLRKSLDDYTGISGPRELKAEMFKALGVEPAKKEKKAGSRPKKEGPTKKSICVEMVSRKEGASLDEMAEAITKAGIDTDTARNRATAKLWMPKLGIPTEKKGERYYAKK